MKELIINSKTKIASILKAKPEALDIIVGISPKFSKLRNPILRKIMAGKASVSMASKIAGCTVEEFIRQLEPLGFVAGDTEFDENPKSIKNDEFPPALSSLKITELDVRPVLDQGMDPFKIIMNAIAELKQGSALKITNTFEPVPLIAILSKKGFKTYVNTVSEDLIETYFYKEDDTIVIEEANSLNDNSDWDQIISSYSNNMRTVDVRNMEMPQPMMTILSELDTINSNDALYVIHKRIPLFLLPELKEKNFSYRIKEISENEVHLIIFQQ